MLDTKDERIRRMASILVSRLPPDAFTFVGHWDGDLLAVGLARPDDDRVLAYVAVSPNAPERFFVELELPPPPESDPSYVVAGVYEDVSVEQVVALVAEHLTREGPR